MPDERRFVRLRGLPWSVTCREILDFLEGVNVVDGEKGVHMVTSRFDGKSTGEAFVELESEKDEEEAFKHDKENMGHRYIEIFSASNEEAEFAMRKPGQSNVVKLRGLPYSIDEGTIEDFFEGLAIKSDREGIVIVMDRRGRASGEAYVQFETQEDTENALKLNREKIGHRYIEIFRSTISELKRATNSNRPNPYDRNNRGGPRGNGGGDNFEGRGNFNRNNRSRGGDNWSNDFGGNRGGGFSNNSGGGNFNSGGFGGSGNNFNNGSGFGAIGGGGGGSSNNRFDNNGGGFGNSNNFGNNRNNNFDDSNDSSSYSNNFSSNRNNMGGVGNFGSSFSGGGNNGMNNFGNNDDDLFVVHMRGLPYYCYENDVKDFFAPLAPTNVKIIYNNKGLHSGTADACFETQDEAQQAMKKDREQMGSRYIELFFDGKSNNKSGGGSGGGFRRI